MHYSLDFRIRVIKFIESGSSKSEASRVFSVTRSTILKLFKRRSESGSLAKRKPKMPCRKLDPVALASYVTHIYRLKNQAKKELFFIIELRQIIILRITATRANLGALPLSINLS